MRPLPDTMAWAATAACRGLGTDAPGPEICEACNVRYACLEHALQDPTFTHGTWGGLTDGERALLLERHHGNVTDALIATARDNAVADARARRRRDDITHPSNPDRDQLSLF